MYEEFHLKEKWFDEQYPVNYNDKISIKFTKNATIADGETITIGDKTYEFSLDETVTEGNTLLLMDFQYLTPAMAKITFTEIPADGETISVQYEGGTDVYEFDTNENVTAGNIVIDISEVTSIVECAEAFITAVAATQTGDTYEYGIVHDVVELELGKVTLYSTKLGAGGNGYDVATTCENAEWDGTEFSGGSNVLKDYQAANLFNNTIHASDFPTSKIEHLDGTYYVSIVVGTDFDEELSTTCDNAEWTTTQVSLATPCPERNTLLYIGGMYYLCTQEGGEYTCQWKRFALESY